MNQNNFSLGRFWLEKISYEDETWVVLGKITAMAGYLEYELLETPAYILEGYYSPRFWRYPLGKPGWHDLCERVKSAARSSDIGPLADEFCHAAGASKAALKKRGRLSHAVIHSPPDGNFQAVSAKISKTGEVSHERFSVGPTELADTLANLIEAYDWLRACRDGLSFARGKRGHPPSRKNTAKAARALKSRGSVPHQREG